MNDLLYSLGLDVTDFKTGAKAANEQAREVKSALRGFKDVIGAGGIGIAVIGFFRSVVQNAMEAKGAVDENTAAVQRFGQALEQNKQSALGWGAQVLGVINRVGEQLGLIARVQIEGGTGFWSNLVKGNFTAAMQSFGKAATDVYREHARDVELSKAEAVLAQQKVEHGNRDAQIRAEAARLAQQEHDLMLKGLTIQERVNQLGNEYWAKVRELAGFEGDALARREKENEVRKAGLVLLQAQQDLTKENAQTEKEAAAAAKQAAAEREKFLDAEAVKHQRIAALRLKGIENLNAAEKVELDILEGRLTKREAELEIQRLLQQGVENLIPADRERLAALIGQTEQIEKQVKALEAQSKIVKAMNVRGLAQFGDASDAALQDLIAKNSAQIKRNEELMFRQGDMSNLTTKWDIARLQQEVANARQELDSRRQLTRNLQLGGEDYARQQFQGDSLLFDEFLQRVSGTWEKQDETNKLLDHLIKRGVPNLTSATQAIAQQLNQHGLPTG